MNTVIDLNYKYLDLDKFIYLCDHVNSIKTCNYCIFFNYGAKHLILEWNDSGMAMEFIQWTVLFSVRTHTLELQFIYV